MLHFPTLKASPTGLIKEFFRTDIIDGATINHVRPPAIGAMELPVIAIIVATAAFIIWLVYLKSSGRGLAKGSAARALVCACLVSGFLFAARMDFTWLMNLLRDVPAFTGKSTADRLYSLTGHDLYVFIQAVKRDIPPGEKVRLTDLPFTFRDSYKTKLGNYYLLPTLASRDGRYLWTFYFSDTYYNAAAGVLSVHGRSFAARPRAIYKPGLGVYEILGEMPGGTEIPKEKD